MRSTTVTVENIEDGNQKGMYRLLTMTAVKYSFSNQRELWGNWYSSQSSKEGIFAL